MSLLASGADPGAKRLVKRIEEGSRLNGLR
jgi:hypothetical protein